MNRPTRQSSHLAEKIGDKEARAKSLDRKPGKRAKRWKKALAGHTKAPETTPAS